MAQLAAANDNQDELEGLLSNADEEYNGEISEKAPSEEKGDWSDDEGDEDEDDAEDDDEDYDENEEEEEDDDDDDDDEDEDQDDVCYCENCLRYEREQMDVVSQLLNNGLQGTVPPSLAQAVIEEMMRPTAGTARSNAQGQTQQLDHPHGISRDEQRGDPINEEDLCAICFQSAGTKCPMVALPCCHKETSTSHFCASCIIQCFTTTNPKYRHAKIPVGECPLCKTLLTLNEDEEESNKFTVALRYPTLDQKFWFMFHSRPNSRPLMLTIAYSNPSWMPDELLCGECPQSHEVARQFLQWGFLQRTTKETYSFPPDQHYALQQLIETSNLCIDSEGKLVVKVTGNLSQRRNDFLFCIGAQTVMMGVWTALKRRKFLTAIRLANHSAILFCVSFQLYPWFWEDPKNYPSSSTYRRILHHHVKKAAYAMCNLFLCFKLVGIAWRLIRIAWNVAAAWGTITIVASVVNPYNRQYRRSCLWKAPVLASLVYYGFCYRGVLQGLIVSGFGSLWNSVKQPW